MSFLKFEIKIIAYILVIAFLLPTNVWARSGNNQASTAISSGPEVSTLHNTSQVVVVFSDTQIPQVEASPFTMCSSVAEVASVNLQNSSVIDLHRVTTCDTTLGIGVLHPESLTFRTLTFSEVTVAVKPHTEALSAPYLLPGLPSQSERAMTNTVLFVYIFDQRSVHSFAPVSAFRPTVGAASIITQPLLQIWRC